MAAWWSASCATCHQGSGRRSSTSLKRSSPRPACRSPPPRGSRSGRRRFILFCLVRGSGRGSGHGLDRPQGRESSAMVLTGRPHATRACRQVGSGFGGTMLTGVEHNDPFYIDGDGRTRTRSNRSGGIQGGISNGETIVLRVAFKPTSTISQEQGTVTRGGDETKLRGEPPPPPFFPHGPPLEPNGHCPRARSGSSLNLCLCAAAAALAM